MKVMYVGTIHKTGLKHGGNIPKMDVIPGLDHLDPLFLIPADGQMCFFLMKK